VYSNVIVKSNIKSTSAFIIALDTKKDHNMGANSCTTREQTHTQ